MTYYIVIGSNKLGWITLKNKINSHNIENILPLAATKNNVNKTHNACCVIFEMYLKPYVKTEKGFEWTV